MHYRSIALPLLLAYAVTAQEVKSDASNAVAGAISTGESAVGEATKTIDSIVDEATSRIAGIATGVATTFLSVQDGATQTLVSVYSNAASYLGSQGAEATQWAGSVFDAAGTEASSLYGVAKSAAESIQSEANGKIAGVTDGAAGAGQTATSALAGAGETATSAIGGAVGKATGAIGGAADAVHHAFGAAPSTVSLSLGLVGAAVLAGSFTGNEAFHLADYKLALERYTRAIEKGRAGPKSERATFHLNRAQALIKLERWQEAEVDCNTAIALAGEVTSYKAYWRRAIARKELGSRVKLRAAMDDLRKWYALVVKDEPRQQTKHLAAFQAEMEFLENKLREDTLAATPSKSRPSAVLSRGADSQLDFPSLDDLSNELEFATEDSSLDDKLTTIRASYRQLSQIWATKKSEMITAWMDLALRDVRRAKCRQAVDALMGMGSLKDYPELRSGYLAQGNNILDLVSARALRDPATFAFHLDAIRARTIVAARRPPPHPAMLFFHETQRPEEPVISYMHILDQEASRYGTITRIDPDSADSIATRDRLLEVGEVVPADVGEVMLERQRVLYVGALQAARVLLDLAGEDAEVDTEVVAEYEEQIKSREYAGREDYSLDRVEEIVRSSLAYSEDYYESLRTDGEFVSEQILDRISAAVKPWSAVFMMLAKEETIVLILNAFARQSIWNECLAVISELRQYGPRCGTSASVPLDPSYVRRIGLLAKLVEAFIGLAFKELSQAIEKCFADEFKKMGADDGDDFWTAMQAAAEAHGMNASRPSPRNVDPLAKMFRALTKLDPASNRKSTFEIVACLNELRELFDQQPGQKSRLSRRLVDGLGEYQEAIELRETILDAHRPYFDMDLADHSTFLARLNPLWTSLERAWLRSASDDTLLRQVLKTNSRLSLDALWDAFDRHCVQDCRDLPDALFDKLATLDGTTPRVQEEAEPSEESQPEGSDEEDDGPPPLISGSDDDDDGPPPLVAEDSDSDEERRSTRLRSRRQVRRLPPRRPAVPRPVQPGPSSGVGPSKRVQTLADPSAITDPTMFGTRLGVRESSTEREARETTPRRNKVKTRKARPVDEGDSSDATVAAGSGTEWETTDSESEREGLPVDFKFPVSKRVYETFELVLGGDRVVRTEVAWNDFTYAMQSIGFQASPTGAGSSWKFRPPTRFGQLGTMNIHEPHPASALRVNQVHGIEARLQRRYKMHIGMFVIDNTNRRQAATVTH
ncbi:hypothetical protein JCM11491_005259 [Sporobolomyces phaffii]